LQKWSEITGEVNIPSSGGTPQPSPTPPSATLYVDGDKDGYGAGAALASCPNGKDCVTNSSDCYDNNKDAFPGQTQYFDKDRGDGSFDYDCSGAITLEYASADPSNNNCNGSSPSYTNSSCSGQTYINSNFSTLQASSCGASVGKLLSTETPHTINVYYGGCDGDDCSCNGPNPTTGVIQCTRDTSYTLRCK